MAHLLCYSGRINQSTTCCRTGHQSLRSLDSNWTRRRGQQLVEELLLLMLAHLETIKFYVTTATELPEHRKCFSEADWVARAVQKRAADRKGSPHLEVGIRPVAACMAAERDLIQSICITTNLINVEQRKVEQRHHIGSCGCIAASRRRRKLHSDRMRKIRIRKMGSWSVVDHVR